MACPQIIGHRGAAYRAPENTLESFRLAFEKYHADWVEFDVRQTREGVPVVLHDATVNRTTNGHGNLGRMTLKTAQTYDAGYAYQHPAANKFPYRGKGLIIPTLESLLMQCRGKHLYVEFKDNSPGLIRRSMTLIKQHGALRRVIAGSLDLIGEVILKKYFPAVPRFCSHITLMQLYMAYRMQKKIPGLGKNLVASMPMVYRNIRYADPLFVDYLKSQKIRSVFWTVNQWSDMRRLADWGVWGIITDRPELGARLHSERNCSHKRSKRAS